MKYIPIVLLLLLFTSCKGQPTSVCLSKLEKKIEEQIDELSNYHLSLQTQISSLTMQYKLSNSVGEMLFELLKLGRKTIVEYKAQLVENFNIAIEHQKTINNLYLLKLKIDEITLTL